MWPPVSLGPTSLDFHLNRPVISLIQLHIVPLPPAGIAVPHVALPIWPLPEPPLVKSGLKMHRKNIPAVWYSLVRLQWILVCD